mmetsp:Transcript_9385/g.10378  ORF Transcript_9385/g.10378 Transcript_9385/m.10378 type:complete len:210 (-) Transcript_9385:87-716(-)
MQWPKFKVAVVGDYGVGKESLVSSLRDHDSKHKYIATLTSVVDEIPLFTSRGKIIVQLFQLKSSEKFGRPRDAFYANSDGAIIMFAVNSRVTYKNTPSWWKDISRVCSIPIVMVGNKIDLRPHKVPHRVILYPARKGLEYFPMSVKEDFNTLEPFLHLLRKIVGDEKLSIVKPPAFQIPSNIDLNHVKDMTQTISQAQKVPIATYEDDI